MQFDEGLVDPALELGDFDPRHDSLSLFRSRCRSLELFLVSERKVAISPLHGFASSFFSSGGRRFLDRATLSCCSRSFTIEGREASGSATRTTGEIWSISRTTRS